MNNRQRFILAAIAILVTSLVAMKVSLAQPKEAIAWTLRHRAITDAIVGGRSAKQVDRVVGVADFRSLRGRNRRN